LREFARSGFYSFLHFFLRKDCGFSVGSLTNGQRAGWSFRFFPGMLTGKD
jgi:hypothetical protein